MDSEDVCTQTLGSSFTGSPSVTSVQLPESSMQALSEVCKEETCDDLPESPMKTKLPNRCASSNLSGLSNDQPAQPEEQLCHSGTVSVNGNRCIELIPCQQTYQTITMTNTGNLCPGTPMMQYVVHSRDGTQTYIMPDDKVVLEATTGDMSAYQICSPTSGLSHDISSSPGSLPSPQQLSEEATRKRELRLLKNREAARECRRKKKEYVKCLENRVAVLEKQNKTLIEELKALKVLVAAKECRRRKKEYDLHLETRLIMLENQNKRLTKELEYFKNVCTGRPKSC